MDQKNTTRKSNYSCNSCVYSMQNSTNRSMACEEETGPCDWFEPLDDPDSRSKEDEL